MAIGELVSNLPELENSISLILTLLKIIGGVIGVYLVFWIINFFINARRLNVLNKILDELQENNKKMDLLIKANSKK